MLMLFRAVRTRKEAFSWARRCHGNYGSEVSSDPLRTLQYCRHPRHHHFVLVYAAMRLGYHRSVLHHHRSCVRSRPNCTERTSLLRLPRLPRTRRRNDLSFSAAICQAAARRRLMRSFLGGAGSLPTRLSVLSIDPRNSRGSRMSAFPRRDSRPRGRRFPDTRHHRTYRCMSEWAILAYWEGRGECQ